MDQPRGGDRRASVPASLVVLGGGTVGVEMATAYAVARHAGHGRSRRARACSAREEPFAGEEVCAALAEARRRGPRRHAARPPSREPTARSTVELDDGSSVSGDELLVAVGRRILTADLGLDDLGVEPGGPIEVDDTLRVPGHDWLYVIGDANGRALLTHMGKYQGRHRRRPHPRPRGRRCAATARLSPRVTFTDPQVAAVGHTLASAQEAGIDARAVDVPTGGNAGGTFVGRGAPGTARIVVDEERRVIVGATFTGPEVAEALHAATIAVIGEVSLDDLWHAVPCFPTRSELWLKLLEEYGM